MGRIAERLLISAVLIALCTCGNKAFRSDTNTRSVDVRSESKKDKKPMQDEMTKDPVMKADIEFADGLLKVNYRIKNTTEVPIYVFNVLWDLDQTNNVLRDARQAFISLDEKSNLHLLKGVLPLPKTRKVESRVVPFVTKLEAGQEFVEKLDLIVPVEEYNPYFPKNHESKLEDVLSEGVVFTVQYIRASSELELKPSPLANSFSIWHPNLFGSIQQLSTDPRRIEIKVKRRLDTFERF
jgi:hypothetical protein